MEQSLEKRCIEYAVHVSALCGLDCSVLDTVRRQFVFASGGMRFCEGCGERRCAELNTHLYGSNEAYRWNGQYIYYCPAGLVFTAASVSDETGEMAGSLVAGPLLMGQKEEQLAELPEELREKARGLPEFPPARVTHLSAVLCACTAFAAGLPNSRAGGFVYEQDKMLSAIYDARERLLSSGDEAAYPIVYEKRLQALIAGRDKDGARRLLNELLGHIYCVSDFDLTSIKARVVELVVLLSRATIDAGADIQEVFISNTNFFHDIEQFTSLEELSVWLTGIMHRFINYSFDFTQVKHSDVVYKVMEYVKANYSRKISLDDVARHVYLSRSYLSSLFKEETGMSLFTYINRVRVEKSKLFLLDNTVALVDVASLCGFEDQSYFTKVFKKETGYSPKKYRDSRGNPSEPRRP